MSGGDEAAPGKKTSIHEVQNFHDSPPRLMVAVNRTTFFARRREPGCTPGSKLPPPRGKDDPILAERGATFVNEILAWVEGCLQMPLAGLWTTDAGRADAFSGDEEEWARRCAELFSCSTYGGGDQITQWWEFSRGDPKPPARVRNLQPHAYLYQRFQQRFAEREEYCTVKLIDQAKMVENTDPAYPLTFACQYLATYVVLSRGFTIEEHMYGVGLTAASNAIMPLFSPALGGKWIGYNSDRSSLDEGPLNAAHAISVGVSPGSVYCYDPYGAVTAKRFMVHSNDLEHTPDGDVVFSGGQPKVRKDRVVAVWNDNLGADVGKQDHDAPNAPVLGDDGDCDGMVEVVLTKNVQAEGSHIFNVLRVEEDKGTPRRLQAFDSASIQWIGDRAATIAWPEDPAVQVPLIKETNGMFEGVWGETVYRGNHYVGVGVLPPAKDLAGATEFIRRARPVGLARMVILKPWDKKDYYRPNASDVIFISRFIRMWGDDPLYNYSPARFVASLRNTPYYEDLKVYWLLYAPGGTLATKMWEMGARKKTVAQLINETYAVNREWNKGFNERHPKATEIEKYNLKSDGHLKTSVDLVCTSIIGHDDYGDASVIWRNEGYGSGVAAAQIFGFFKAYFINLTSGVNTGKKWKFTGDPIPWHGQYVHPAIDPDGYHLEVPELFSPEEPEEGE